MKKTIALILTVVFAVALLPMTAGAAAFSNGAMTLTIEGGTPVEGTHYTYEPEPGTTGYRLTLLTSGGSYILGGAASDKLRVVASATDITLTLDSATFTGPDDAVGIVRANNATGAIEFPHGGALVARGTSAVTGGNHSVESTGAAAVLVFGDLALEVPDGASLTLTGGQGTITAIGALYVSFADLQLTVGGTLRCETADAKGHAGSVGITAGHISLAYTSAAGRVEAVANNGGYGIAAQTLTVAGEAGTLIAQGRNGIYVWGDMLDLGAARVTAVGETNTGIWFDDSVVSAAALRGSGTLTAQGGVYGGVAYPGIRAEGDLTLAFTGDLAATGGSGASRMFVGDLVAGDGLLVYGNLTVLAVPRSLVLTPGVWNGEGYDAQGNLDATVTPDGFYPARVGGKRWTFPSDGEWVTVWPTDKANPHTGK